MRFFVLFLTLLLVSCAITNANDNYAQTVTSWRWTHVHSLLQNWGRPSKIVQLPSGNQAYIYSKESYRNYPPPSITSTFGTEATATGKTYIVVPTPPSEQPEQSASYLLECTTTFEVDPQGIIVDARARGNSCSGDPGFVISRSNPHPLRPASASQRTYSQ